MRVSQEEKTRSHARIVASASRLFRERGLEGASVIDVMRDAGMTHGGFYRHFETKEMLVESAIAAAFADVARALGDGEPADAFAAYRSRYLSQEHRDNSGIGCPVATLGSEIARAPDQLKAGFGVGVRRIVATIAKSLKGSARARRMAAIREFSMLVGAMVIARGSDPETACEVLSACEGRAHDVH